MNTLVVYDSKYGNTEQIAQAIAAGAGTSAKSVISLLPSEIADADLIFLGSPTQGGRPTEAMQYFLSSLPFMDGVAAAAFDTHHKSRWVGVFGQAAPKIANRLSQLGASIVAEPAGFLVAAGSGPLMHGELERAKIWGEKIIHEWRLS